MSRSKGKPPLTTGPMPAILVPPPSSLGDSPSPGSVPDLTVGGAAISLPPPAPGRMSYRSDEEYQTDGALPPVSQRRAGDFLQRNPDHYRPDYGSARSQQQVEKTTKRKQVRNCPTTDSMYADDEINTLRVKNRSLKVELDDHVSRLELLKTDNDNLIQRLGDARKDRERIEQELERERREFREKIREFEKARGDWKDGPHSRILDQTVAEKTELADKVRRLEVELAREREQNRRLQLQAASVGAGGSRNEHLDAELRRYKADVERLDNELRRETIRAEELASDLSALRQSTVSVGRERDLEAKVDRIQREADNNYKKLQEALTENERLRKTRIPAEIERDLNGQIEKLTANIKGKERQIDDLTQEIRKLTSAKTDLEKANTDLESALSDIRREVQRTRVDVDGARDFSEREVARLRAENERLRAERDMEQFRSPRRVPSEPDIRIAASAAPSRLVRSEGQAGPLQDLVKEQESHISDLRREIETLRGAVSDYQKEVDRLHVMADDEAMTREKFNDIASAHRRLLDENARLLLLLDQRHQAETRAITDKSEVARNLTEAKKRLEVGNRRIAQLERWLDEIYNDKDFEVIPKRGAYSNGHICRGAYPLPKMQVPLALTERRRAQIRRLLDESRTATSKGAGYSTDRL